MAKLSKYLFHAEAFTAGDDEAARADALRAARECEQSGGDYPETVRRAAQHAYALLQEAAPEVAAELGQPPS
ncbi:MAG: hypothetical protein L0H59_17800 [Tomitella sp.]|nr:hypothetical protein [Tomitella sp.]